MEIADRGSTVPCPSEHRVLRMLDRIADEVEAYESTADGGPPVTDDEVERFRREHAR